MSGSGISWAICKSAPRSRQITTPAPNHSVFTGRMPFLPPNQQRQSTEGNNSHQKGAGYQMWGIGSVIRGSGSQTRGTGSEIRRDPPRPISLVRWKSCDIRVGIITATWTWVCPCRLPRRLSSYRLIAVETCLLLLLLLIMPSVLWRCWLGGWKGIRPVKNWAAGCWRGYLSGARCRLAYGPADATATHCLLLQ